MLYQKVIWLKNMQIIDVEDLNKLIDDAIKKKKK